MVVYGIFAGQSSDKLLKVEQFPLIKNEQLCYVQIKQHTLDPLSVDATRQESITHNKTFVYFRKFCSTHVIR